MQGKAAHGSQYELVNMALCFCVCKFWLEGTLYSPFLDILIQSQL